MANNNYENIRFSLPSDEKVNTRTYVTELLERHVYNIPEQNKSKSSTILITDIIDNNNSTHVFCKLLKQNEDNPLFHTIGEEYQLKDVAIVSQSCGSVLAYSRYESEIIHIGSKIGRVV